MTKTLINLDDADKAWLDREARRRNVPMTELVRQAVRSYRVREQQARKPSLRDALTQTSGLWRQGDGLVWQERMREEWSRE